MSLQDWPRPYFDPKGADPDITYIAYGPAPKNWNISASKYRVNGMPDGIAASGYGPNQNPQMLDFFRQGYLWGEFKKSNPKLYKLVAKQTEAILIRGAVKNPKSLNYFRDIVGVIEWLFDNGTKAVFDTHAFIWWSKEEWHKRAFEPNMHVATHHVSILYSDDVSGDGDWLHTRGMRKFGRPDLSVRRVPQDKRETAAKMLNRFITILAEGGMIEEGREVNMPGIPSGMTCRSKGHLDDPDFNNVHVEMVWPNPI